MPMAVSAGPSEHLGWGQQLHAGGTACPAGDQVLNVSYKIVNSVDSGTGTNDSGAPWWAVIDYVLQVQVSQTGADTFCATAKTQGSFVSVGGDGPGCANDTSCGTSALGPGVVGTFQGGYTQTFTGTFAPDGQRTRGSLGTFDHGCDPEVDDPGCDGAGVTRWLGLYFTGVSGFDFDEWWGWVYHAGNNGSWVNAIDGNSGNITGE
jgi:hypothetical protein